MNLVPKDKFEALEQRVQELETKLEELEKKAQ